MVVYRCRRCGRRIGEYPGAWDDPLLGLVQLSAEDQRAFVASVSADVTEVRILCEHCLPVPYDEGLWYN
ncbi:MAG: DUF2757 domain-containing protein [Sulfobacillus thermosulfidooxidans]|nr:MAG: DUF2757 domain-containing protein [Sulfobacillus thermosulfidooxidans]